MAQVPGPDSDEAVDAPQNSDDPLDTIKSPKNAEGSTSRSPDGRSPGGLTNACFNRLLTGGPIEGLQIVRRTHQKPWGGKEARSWARANGTALFEVNCSSIMT